MARDKKIKEGFGGLNPNQGKLFEAFPERDYKAIAERERQRKAKEKAKREAEAKKKQEGDE